MNLRTQYSQFTGHYKGAVAQWLNQRTSVLEVAGLIPAPVIVVAVLSVTDFHC